HSIPTCGTACLRKAARSSAGRPSSSANTSVRSRLAGRRSSRRRTSRPISMHPASRLRGLFEGNRCIVAPGVADALAARLVARGGFEAVYMTGFGTSVTRLGLPDVGLLTQTEMVDNAARIVDAWGLPVIADADTGYGNPVNVRRAIRDYEKAGVAGVHIEDQVWPKRCGHLAGKRVIPVAEMEAKIRAACDARASRDFI